MEENRKAPDSQLETVNQSIFFLILIILSVLLSFWSVLIQRETLARAAEGRTDAAGLPPVDPIKRSASSLIVGALGFFFVLALRTRDEAARAGDTAALPPADRNVWASLLVLAAALIRFADLRLPAPAAQEGPEGTEEPETGYRPLCG